MGLFNRKKKEKDRPKSEETAKEAMPAGRQDTTPVAPTAKLPKGEDAYSYQIILRPIITEKGGLMEKYGKYFFKVAKSANKIEIKGAIEKLYKVGVDKVHMISVPPKFRRVGEHEGKKPGFKKAIVTLKKGDKIEIAR